MPTQTLEGLHDGARQRRIANCILDLAIQSKSNARTKTARAHKARRIQAKPYPGAARTLARPFTNLSGRRHVPVLVNANRVPMLRIKKPQPPFLSRIIRDTANTRERRIVTADRLVSELPTAEDEDQWDEILHERYGLPLEEPWDREIRRSFYQSQKMQGGVIRKRIEITTKMYAIVEQEKALAKEEKLRIRDEKHKASKARRLARRGLTESEIQEKLYPQSEKTATHHVPTTTEQVSKQGQGEVRQREWRKRGNKYNTSDELKQRYEASFRPRTDEEIAQIIEGRVRRKLEKAERKVQKLKRGQENAALRRQKANKDAKDSRNKRVGVGQTGKLG